MTHEKTAPATRLGSWLFIALAAAVTLYLFATKVSHSYFLGDDAFISFRYAEHLVEGRGLVWNPGERVEGYTNFLWVLLMALSMVAGIAPELSSNVLGILSGGAVLFAVLSSRARRTSWTDPFAWLPVLLLASSESFTGWCTGGLETMFFTLMALLGTLGFLSERKSGCSWQPSWIFFALASLTRPEGALFALIAGLFYLAEVVRRRRRFRAILLWALPYLAVVGTHALWRHDYYGYWLPNTFYAKVSGLWWEQGARYFTHFADTYHVLWTLPLLLVAVTVKRTFETWLFATILVIYSVYILNVGGDRFEFRFLVPVLPYFYCLLSSGLNALYSVRPGPLRQPMRSAVAIACLFLAVQTKAGSLTSIPLADRNGIAIFQEMSGYARNRTEQGKFLAQLVEQGQLSPDTIIGVGGAGALPYYSKLTTIDRRGLNDVRIARMPLGERGWIGHEHDAPIGYLEERHVALFDVFNRLVHDNDRGVPTGKQARHDGVTLPVRAVRLNGKYLVFLSFVSDDELQALIPGGKLLP